MKRSDAALAVQSYAAALAVHGKLIADNPENVLLKEMLAKYDLEQGDAEAALGQYSQALELYLQARDTRERVVSDEPEDRFNQFNLARIYRSIGNVQLEQGAVDLALNSLSLGVAIFERVAKSDPDHAPWSHELSVAYSAIAHGYDAPRTLKRPKRRPTRLTRSW